MYNTSRDCEVSILVNGRPVTEVQFSGHTYIEGRKNSIYELQIRNKTPNKILAIPSVDGLNVVDGESCGVNSPGYVIDPWKVITIPGWKVDSQQAAKFVFKPQSASSPGDKTYAEQMGGDATNQGIIGVMVFHQKVIHTNYILKEYTPWKIPDSGNPPPFCGMGEQFVYSSNANANHTSNNFKTTCCDNADADKSIGTGFGEATGFETQDVEFDKDSDSPSSVFILYYDTVQGLKRRGVPVERFRNYATETANPFPASPNITGGCTPPAGWNTAKYRK